MRGEQMPMHGYKDVYQGSPPLARGTGVEGAVEKQGKGITPACAGNSRADLEKWVRRKDHPRLRGEQLPYIACLIAADGSPPLARGTVGFAHNVSP